MSLMCVLSLTDKDSSKSVIWLSHVVVMHRVIEMISCAIFTRYCYITRVIDFIVACMLENEFSLILNLFN